MSDTLDITCELVSRPSVTPEDAGCQAVLGGRLSDAGFKVEHLPFGEVRNLWARYGTTPPVLVFAGHTDVVPPGPAERWTSPPFEPTVRGANLFGRGTADMKGSVAAMVTACERFFARHSDPVGSLAFLLTSDEEGPARDGTLRVVEHLRNRGTIIDWCLVGEPSSVERVGDVVKNGRRGSLNAQLRIKGIQGHVAYPDRAANPIHRALPALSELTATRWDSGNEWFPPTSLQISNASAGTGAENVIPGHLDVSFNFRFSTAVTTKGLEQRVAAILDGHGLDYDLAWSSSGDPFLTRGGVLLGAVQEAVNEITGQHAAPSTGGGTSDGRFIAPTGAEVIELGPVNASIHKVDEHVCVAELDLLSRIYERVLEKLLLEKPGDGRRSI